jgi:hypothetical protein
LPSSTALWRHTACNAGLCKVDSPTPGASASGRFAMSPMRKVEIREDAAVAVMRLAFSDSCDACIHVIHYAT